MHKFLFAFVAVLSMAALATGGISQTLLVSEANSVEVRKQIVIDSGQWQAMTSQEQSRIMEQAAKGHLSPQYVGELAARAGVKTVVLTHLTPLPSGNDYSGWAEEVRKRFSGEVLIAKDLMEF
jgi:hypothetical protein